MKKTLKIVLAFGLFASLTQLSRAADTAIFTADFSNNAPSTYNYSGGGADPTVAVTDGTLIFTADLSPSSANTGVRWTQSNTSANTDANLADYTVSFDLAVSKGALTNVNAGLTIGGSATDNVSTSIDLSKVTTDGTYAHYSFNLGDLTFNQFFNGGTTKLNPTDSSFTFEFAAFGSASGSVTFKIKNLKITRLVKDSSSSSQK